MKPDELSIKCRHVGIYQDRCVSVEIIREIVNQGTLAPNACVNCRQLTVSSPHLRRPLTEDDFLKIRKNPEADCQ